jgi:hypothetical protein
MIFPRNLAGLEVTLVVDLSPKVETLIRDGGSPREAE